MDYDIHTLNRVYKLISGGAILVDVEFSINGGTPIAGWFTIENPICKIREMDNLVYLHEETSIMGLILPSLLGIVITSCFRKLPARIQS